MDPDPPFHRERFPTWQARDERMLRRGLTIAALGFSTRGYCMQFAAPPRSLSREEVRAVDEKAIAMGLPGMCLCETTE